MAPAATFSFGPASDQKEQGPLMAAWATEGKSGRPVEDCSVVTPEPAQASVSAGSSASGAVGVWSVGHPRPIAGVSPIEPARDDQSARAGERVSIEAATLFVPICARGFTLLHSDEKVPFGGARG
jgi:hypothetical protein